MLTNICSFHQSSTKKFNQSRIKTWIIRKSYSKNSVHRSVFTFSFFSDILRPLRLGGTNDEHIPDDYCADHGAVPRHDNWRRCGVFPSRCVEHQRFLPRRPQARPAGHRHERGGLRHELLSADGPAGSGVPRRTGGGQLDHHRSGGGHLSQLPAGVQAPARLLRAPGRHYRAGLLLTPLRGQAPSALPDCRAGHHRVLCALHRLRLQGRRHAVRQPVWLGLPRVHAHRRGGHHRLYGAGRLPGRVHHRPHPVRLHDGCAGHHRALRREPGGRHGRRARQREGAAGLSGSDQGLQLGRRHGRQLRHAEHRVHAGVGPGLLRHAAYPAALHGHPRQG